MVLYRGGFFTLAAFYGGTALRIFYDLDRFSEDLDFSLLKPDSTFELSSFTSVLQDELGAYGMEMTVEEKIKQSDSAIKSAFIKGGTEIHLLRIASITPPVSGVHPNEQIKIKVEVDTNPPPGAEYEMKYGLTPVPHSVRLFAPSSLFAGKVHAILCRSWQSRVKGRDFYDYIWYLSKRIPLNIHHLAERMIQSGHLHVNEILNEETLFQRLNERFQAIDFDQVKKDLLPFIKNPDSLQLWSVEFFSAVTRDNLKIDRGTTKV